MNILYIAGQVVVSGNKNEGDHTHVSEVVKSLKNNGHEVYLLAYGEAEKRRFNGIKIFNASIKKRSVINYLDKYLLTYLLSALLNKFVCLFTGNVKESLFVSYLLRRIIKAKKIDLIYERHSNNDPGTNIGKELGIKTILEINGITPLELRARGLDEGFINKRLLEELECMRRAHGIVSVSKGNKDYYVSKGIDSAKIKVVPNGVNLNIFRPMGKYACREKIGLDNSVLYIGIVATFRIYQGLEYALKCMPYIVKECPGTKLVIVGHSDNNFRPTKYDLLELADKLGVNENLFLAGSRPYAEIPYYINAFDLCLAFREHDGYSWCSIKLLEYMACARLVVSSYHDDLRFIEEEGAGILVNHRNSEETGRVIARLLKNKKTCQEMGERGFNYARKNGSWDKVAMEILKIK